MALKNKQETPLPLAAFPASLEAERAVLRSLLTDKEALIPILSSVTVDDFTSGDHQTVFRVIAELFEKNQKIDMVTVSISFQKNGGKGAIVADLFKDHFVGNYQEHIRFLKDLTRRRMAQAAILLASEGIRGTDDVDGVIATLISSLSQATNDLGKRPLLMSEVVVRSVKRIERAIQRGNIVEIPSGFTEFDSRIGGFHKGDLNIVADRPSGGKSALLACIAVGAAKQGYPSCLVNAEMESIDVGTRLLAGESGVENFALRAGRVDDSEVAEVMRAAGVISPLPIWIYDDNRWDVIKAQVMALKMARPDLAIVLIDYVTRIHVEPRQGELRYQEIGRVSKEAKSMAQNLGLTVIMAAQISRGARKEQKEPVIEDLRECGDLEQDADMVTFIHRYQPDKSPWEVYWLIKKNRNGPLGHVKLRWAASRVRFYDWDDNG